jgi:spore maturation protein CgeB
MTIHQNPGHRLLILGNEGNTNVGESFRRSATVMNVPCQLVPLHLGFGGSKLWRSFTWRFRDRRPSTYHRLLKEFIRVVSEFRPTVCVVTGVAWLTDQLFDPLHNLGIPIANFLTDDPFNRNLGSNQFFRTLQRYSVIFTPRLANQIDLLQAGAQEVVYLPFGYDPVHVQPGGESLVRRTDSILYIGGGDADRFKLATGLLDHGLPLEVIGDYWQKLNHPLLTNLGWHPAPALAASTRAAAVNLILVRRANRDGHVMRSFEAAACGGCLLAEDTTEHRQIYGDTVAYFRNTTEIVEQAKVLLNNPERRKAMAEACRQRIVTGGNTYTDRLKSILSKLTPA